MPQPSSRGLIGLALAAVLAGSVMAAAEAPRDPQTPAVAVPVVAPARPRPADPLQGLDPLHHRADGERLVADLPGGRRAELSLDPALQAYLGKLLAQYEVPYGAVVALEPATGKWRWQYERDMPEGFTIHGYAGPRLRGAHLLAGFADGYFVALSAASGEVVWAKSLAAASDQFVDVDSTPALSKDVAYVSSYSGGLYALDARDGSVRWRLGIEGVGDVTADADRLYFVAPRYGLHAAHPDGHVLWRQGLSAAGDLTHPIVVGNYLIFSGSRAGMFVVDRNNGELLEIFNPGQGVCAAPTVDVANHRLFVLSNSGSLYSLNLI